MVVEAHEGLHITIKSPRGCFQAFEKTSTRRRRGEERRTWTRTRRGEEDQDEDEERRTRTGGTESSSKNFNNHARRPGENMFTNRRGLITQGTD